MDSRLRNIILMLVFSLSVATLVFAETIYLKSGKKIDAEIIEESKEYIKIEFHGVPVVYYRDEIERIKGQDKGESQSVSIEEGDSDKDAIEDIFSKSRLKLKDIKGYQLRILKEEVISKFLKQVSEEFKVAVVWPITKYFTVVYFIGYCAVPICIVVGPAFWDTPA